MVEKGWFVEGGTDFSETAVEVLANGEGNAACRMLAEGGRFAEKIGHYSSCLSLLPLPFFLGISGRGMPRCLASHSA